MANVISNRESTTKENPRKEKTKIHEKETRFQRNKKPSQKITSFWLLNVECLNVNDSYHFGNKFRIFAFISEKAGFFVDFYMKLYVQDDKII